MRKISKVQQAVRDIDDAIDREYHPEKMSPEEAIEFLETVSTNIDAKIEALKEENDL